LDIYVVVVSVSGFASAFGGAMVDALIEAADFDMDIIGIPL
jgi:hypothetical protein